MDKGKLPQGTSKQNAAKAVEPLSDGQLDQVVGGARPSGKPIIIVGG